MQEELSEKSDGRDVHISAVEVRRIVAGHIPPSLVQKLTERDDVRRALGFEHEQVTLSGRDISVQDLVEFLSRAVAGETVSLLDIDGVPIASDPVPRAGGGITAMVDGKLVGFGEAGLFADDPVERLRTFDIMTRSRTLSPLLARRWREMLSSEKPGAAELAALHSDIEATAEAFVERVAATPADELTLDDLVVSSSRYYGNLLDHEPGDDSLSSVLANLADRMAASANVRTAARTAATLAVSPELPIAAMIRSIDDAGVADLGAALADEADPFSRVAGFAMLADRASDAACRDAATTALDRLIGAQGTIDASADFFVASATVALTSLDRGVLADIPLASRRALALAHAGHACRALRRYGVNPATLPAMSRTWSSSTWLLGAALDSCDGIIWRREWLRRDAIALNVVHPLMTIIESVPEEHRPERWVEIVSFRAEELRSRGLSIAMPLPGPLDEFSEARPIEPEDGKPAIEGLRDASLDDAYRLLSALSWANVPPDQVTTLRE